MLTHRPEPNLRRWYEQRPAVISRYKTVQTEDLAFVRLVCPLAPARTVRTSGQRQGPYNTNLEARKNHSLGFWRFGLSPSRLVVPPLVACLKGG